jgi:ABC-2 type transport system ATP-binding protein
VPACAAEKPLGRTETTTEDTVRVGYDNLTERDKIKRHVGYMTQRLRLYQDLSIKENLEFVARIYDMADPSESARQAIERLGLRGRELKLAGTLSCG